MNQTALRCRHATMQNLWHQRAPSTRKTTSGCVGQHVRLPSSLRLRPCLRAAAAASSPPHGMSMTQHLLEEIDARGASGVAAGGAGGGTTYQAFCRADQAWSKLKNMPVGSAAGSRPTFVTTTSEYLTSSTQSNQSRSMQGSNPTTSSNEQLYDVVVCGGTLGVFIAAALAVKGGLRVAVVERGALRGREQEWNISRKEMRELVQLGLMTESELESSIKMEFNPVRVGFHGAGEVWTCDVLNCGVSPNQLIQTMRQRLEQAGGKVFDNTGLQGVCVHPDGVNLQLTDQQGSSSSLQARLMLDCMGHASPIVKQIRWGQKPDGVCIVVGTLSSGFTNNSTADVIYTHTDMQAADQGEDKLFGQLFWEAFPAGSGPTDRTTYMFAYMDAAAWRPSMHDMFDLYWKLMPDYQGIKLQDITFKRALFGMFPTYRNSPLQPGFDRILQVGDASGIQSPLSFGGFGALTRHLARVSTAIEEAVKADALDATSLGLIHAYNPGLSSSWMLQRAMSVRQNDKPAPDLINRMLGDNFKAMNKLGDKVLKPFLHDVIQLGPLLRTMTTQMLDDPRTVPQLLVHVGPGPLLDWVRHVGGLATFTALYQSLGGPLQSVALSPQLNAKQRYTLRRLVEGWQYGAGLDYKH